MNNSKQKTDWQYLVFEKNGKMNTIPFFGSNRAARKFLKKNYGVTKATVF